MKSLREIIGEFRGRDSNLGDIKHKFRFHSDCTGLNSLNCLIDASILMGNREIQLKISDVHHAVVCFPEVRGLRSLFGLCC